MEQKANSFLFYVVVWILSTLFFATPSLVIAKEITTDSIIALVNYERIQQQLPPLSPHDKLRQAADARIKDMLSKNYFNHQSPTGTMPWDTIAENGYEYRYAGENLAIDYDNAEEVVNAWLESPTHRENMLSNTFQDIGVSVNEHDDHTMIVLLFGSEVKKTATMAQTANQDILQTPSQNQSLSIVSIANLPITENLIHIPQNEAQGLVLGVKTPEIRPVVFYLIPACFIYLILSFLIFPLLAVETVDIPKS